MKIKTKLIQTVQDLERLKGFALSFGHKVNESLQSIVLMTEDDNWIGYLQLIKTPILLVGLHPELSKGRVSVEAIKKIQAWSELQYGEALAGVNSKSNFNEILPRMDFKDIDLKLFKSKG